MPPVTPLPQINILNILGRFRYLSAPQLCRLLYAPTSHAPIDRHLPIMTRQGIITHIEKPRTGKGGKSLYIHTPTAKGWRRLGRKPKRVGEWNDHMQHRMECNDLVILAHELTRRNRAYKCATYWTEQELKEKPAGGVSPDGIVVLENSTHHFPIVFEVDRGTEEREEWQDKFRALVDYSQFAYKVHIDSEYLTIAILLTKDDERRFLNLLAWCRQVVPPRMQGMFVFGFFRPDQVEPDDAFTSPIWISPRYSTPSSLIPSR